MRALAAILFCLALLACEDEQVAPRELDRSGEDFPVQADDSWASGPWPWLTEDPEIAGLIEIAPQSLLILHHGLGRTPLEVHCYVGFSADATWVMPSAGNACEVHDPLDEEILTIRNGSGGSFYYRFVLR